MELLDKEIQILRRTDSIGNKVLYNLCKEYPLAKDMEIDALSAQIWLIGRSYAASPERRSYGIGKVTDGGTGLETFFEQVSSGLLKKNEFKDIVIELNKMNEKYAFDFSDKDMCKLNTVIKSVENFNKIMKNVIFEIDENILKKREIDLKIAKDRQNNLISFCSKFLHFHYPEIVFIKDSISESHFKLLKEDKNCYGFIFDNETSDIKIDKKYVINILGKLEKDKTNSYAVHCVREYLLGKKIADITNVQPKPRAIDNYVLNANVVTK